MSLGSSSGINFSGLSSGIDTDSIVTKLMSLERINQKRLQSRQSTIEEKKSAYGEFKTKLTALRSALGALNNANSYSTTIGSSSTTDVATILGGASAAEGTYSLKVYQLAAAQKLSSTPQTDTTSAIGLAGTISVGGKSIDVVATDTLTSISQKINDAGGDVTASVINGGSGNAYLTFTSKKTGNQNNIKLADTTGTVLQSLGFTATTVRSAVTNGATSFAASSASATLNSFLGFNATGPTDVTINGQTVSIDPTTDTLTSLATKIDGLTGVNASVVSSTEMGRTVYRLQVTGDSGTPTFGAEGSVLTDLGITKRTSELVAAKDALYSLDGVSLSAASNTVSDSVPGATITLLQADASTPKEATLTLARDTGAIKSKITSLVSAYNDLKAFIDDNSKFDTKTFQSGLLFGDSTTGQIQSEISNLIFGTVDGNASGYQGLASLGFSFATGGTLQVNDTILSDKLKSNPTAFANVFKTTGTTIGSDLTYVSTTSKTLGNKGTPLDVLITQLATKSTVEGNTALVGTTAGDEHLTFAGGPFGTSGIVLDLSSGLSMDNIVDRINNDSRLKDYVTASNDGGKLKLTSSRYGTPGRFTVTSDLTAAANNSGIGNSGESTVVNGLDVAGTINGEPATGSGQYLTGNDDATLNPQTNGLQILYTGSTLGSVGTVSIVRGIAGILSGTVDGFTDATNGMLTTLDKSLQNQIDDLDEAITQEETRLTAKEASLRAKFLAMEQAIAASQAQSQQFAAMLTSSTSG
ncbi:MAG: flagellar filament capping protein FliD [Armatimonadetes bacterium]|nr:flagellar filament capping protein FliD [Armatimonadota bacterium]